MRHLHYFKDRFHQHYCYCANYSAGYCLVGFSDVDDFSSSCCNGGLDSLSGPYHYYAYQSHYDKGVTDALKSGPIWSSCRWARLVKQDRLSRWEQGSWWPTIEVCHSHCTSHRCSNASTDRFWNKAARCTSRMTASRCCLSSVYGGYPLLSIQTESAQIVNYCGADFPFLFSQEIIF